MIVGHVDHGKSTLVGRLLHETGALPEGKVQAVKAMSEKRGMPFEWAFVIDAMQAERDQGITIDTTQIRFKTAARDYLLIDAPGHKQFLKNMVSGAAGADAVVLVVDAHEGVQDQTRRHAYLLRLLGIRRIIVAVNKMDLVGYAEERYQEVRRDVAAYLRSIGVDALDITSCRWPRATARTCAAAARCPGTRGPTLLRSARRACRSRVAATDLPLRLTVQDVYKFDQRRIIAGRIESGSLHVGDTLLFSPINASARVASIESWNAPAPTKAGVGQSVGITLDEDIFIERGHVASHGHSAPVVTNVFRANLFWLGREALVPGAQYRLRRGAAETPATVERIDRAVDTNTLASGPADKVEWNGIAEVTIRTRGLLALDHHADNALTGRFVLVDGHQIVGGGTASTEGYPNQRRDDRAQGGEPVFGAPPRRRPRTARRSNGHRGGILWFTGLSGAGKTTLAVELERRLFAKGYQTFLLDGDNVRQGLNADLGFAPQERAENIRRVGEVSALFAEAGMIVVSAFISPYRVDRDRIRAAHGAVLQRDLHQRAAARLRVARREGAVQEGARRPGEGIHRHLGAVRGAGGARAGGAERRVDDRALPRRPDGLRRAAPCVPSGEAASGQVVRIFVFNGDADGLCALQQLRLAEGAGPAQLVTGPKRRTALLAAVAAGARDEVTVLDVSFHANRDAVLRLLAAGARVRYFDHHHAGELPAHERLEAHIDLAPTTCTSAIVDRYLAGRHRAWAAVGAFGDNLADTGRALAAGFEDSSSLERLGVLLNYNSYGETEADLFFPPAELHRRLAAYADPLSFVRSGPRL